MKNGPACLETSSEETTRPEILRDRTLKSSRRNPNYDAAQTHRRLRM